MALEQRPLEILHALDEALQKSSHHPGLFSNQLSESPWGAQLDASCTELIKLVMDLYAAAAVSGDVSTAYADFKASVNKCNSLSHVLQASGTGVWLDELNEAGQQLKDHLMVRDYIAPSSYDLLLRPLNSA